jgi:serine/threonine protein kinase
VDDNLQSIIEKRMEAQNKSSGSISHGSRILDVDEIKRSISNQDMAVGSKMSESATPFKLPEAVDIMLQIATGMKYLHDNEIAHGDLKPNNVLLYISKSGQMIVKLADYGLVETKKRIKLVSKRTRHFEVLMWKAPERLEELLGPVSKNSDDPFTESDTDSDEEMESSVNFEKSRLAMADVYSFGLICLHILGGELLDPDLSLTRLREQRMKPIRPGPPSACPNYLRSMILSSLGPQSSRTPTFSGICSWLKASQSVQLPVLIEGAIRVLVFFRCPFTFWKQCYHGHSRITLGLVKYRMPPDFMLY